MSLMEVDGADWRWLHGFVILVIKNGNDFINKLRVSRRNTFTSFMVSSSLSPEKLSCYNMSEN